MTRWSLAAAGLVAGLLAPLGYLAIRLAGGVHSNAWAELTEHASLYAYLTVESCLVLSAFGLLAGTWLERYRKELVRQRALVTTDALTGLRNAGYFRERLEEECRRGAREGRPVGLIVLDVDRFKRINDEHGHRFGDHALATLARVIRGQVRVSDVPCRSGGDEFAVICPGVDLTQLSEIAMRIRDSLALSSLEAPDGTAVPLSASFGAALLVRDRSSAELFEAADAALYRAKRQTPGDLAVAQPLMGIREGSERAPPAPLDLRVNDR